MLPSIDTDWKVPGLKEMRYHNVVLRTEEGLARGQPLDEDDRRLATGGKRHDIELCGLHNGDSHGFLFPHFARAGSPYVDTVDDMPSIGQDHDKNTGEAVQADRRSGMRSGEQAAAAGKPDTTNDLGSLSSRNCCCSSVGTAVAAVMAAPLHNESPLQSDTHEGYFTSPAASPVSMLVCPSAVAPWLPSRKVASRPS